MKLKNKQTGEIVDLDIAILKAQFGGISVIPKPHLIQGEEYVYDSLAGLTEEWEDYEGEWPQVGDTYYAIHNNGTIHEHHWEQNQENQGRPVFNIFKTRKESSEALGKWNALVELEEKGYKFELLNNNGERK